VFGLALGRCRRCDTFNTCSQTHLGCSASSSSVPPALLSSACTHSCAAASASAVAGRSCSPPAPARKHSNHKTINACVCIVAKDVAGVHVDHESLLAAAPVHQQLLPVQKDPQNLQVTAGAGGVMLITCSLVVTKPSEIPLIRSNAHTKQTCVCARSCSTANGSPALICCWSLTANRYGCAAVMTMA
jgi:hypothetical protein